MRPVIDPLHGQGLYITHLARRLEAMEQSARLHAVTYRLFARRLHAALAGYPAARAARLAEQRPCVRHALAQRHFDVHGVLPGDGAACAHHGAWDLFRRLGCRPR